MLPNTEILQEKALNIQKRLLNTCVKILEKSGSEFFIFVHLRSIVMASKGRHTIYDVVCAETPDHIREQIKRCLEIQYEIEPSFRTYNELIVRKKGHKSSPNICFSFGDNIEFGDIHFNREQVINATNNFSFLEIKLEETNSIDISRKSDLAKARLSIGLNIKVQEQFGLELSDSKIPSFTLPDEIRYSIQVLMLWSNTMQWRYIETHHSQNSFDSLSNSVITVCSSTRKLNPDETKKIIKALKEEELSLQKLVREKTELLPENDKATCMPSKHIQQELTVRASDERYWQGRDAFFVIDHIREQLFASTHEGVAETYAFIFGHPGFIARPEDLKNGLMKLSSIKHNREFCEGLLDRLNVVDIFGDPQCKLEELCFTPIDFPLYAKNLIDSQQAHGSFMERLSLAHYEMIAVGLVCRNIMMVYKSGRLICVFNGTWNDVKSLSVVAQELGIPEEVAKNPRFLEIYGILTRLALGPCSRSVIVAYSDIIDAFEKIPSDELHPFGKSFGEWATLSPQDSIEPNLMRASKTDGAILIYPDSSGNFKMKSRVRVIIKDQSSSSNSTDGSESQPITSGTGDATAQSIAKEWKGFVTMKVSQDGGMKVRWQDYGPESVSIPSLGNL
jgi:hypothetical protein